MHIASQHPEALSDGFEDLLSIAEINIMCITKCPLCDSTGPQDSPKIIEHVFQHVHNFSLRSLPWPMDLNFSLERPVGLFDMEHASKTIKDDKGNEYVLSIEHWLETTVDQRFEEEDLEIAGWPDDRTLKDDHSLQLCDVDRNPPKPSEEDLAAIAKFETDYFAQNDYFIDESGDGRFSSPTSHSSQTQNSIKPTPSIAESSRLQSVILKNEGRLKEAEELFVHVMEMEKEILGKEHSHTLISMANLAYIYKAQDRTDKAIELIKKVIELRSKVIGANHPHTIVAINACESWVAM